MSPTVHAIDASIVARAQQAAVFIAPLAEQIEQGRRLPVEAVGALVEAGVFKLLVPREYGGAQTTVPTVLAVIEAIARADGSAGWCTMIATTSGLMSAFLPPDVARDVYAAADAITGGVFAPMGRATPVEGGLRVRGRWTFCSGCQHSQWILGGVMVETQDPTRPELRSVLFHRDEVEIHDTWDTSGLRGTGTLRVGDFVLAGAGFGKIRAMTNEHGKTVHAAGPSTPVEILGLGDRRAGLGVAADQRAAHEHLREGRPAAPHLDRQALLPGAEVAAELEVGERHAGLGQRLPGLLDEGVLGHADDDDRVAGDRLLDPRDDLGVKSGDLVGGLGGAVGVGEQGSGRHRGGV